MTVDSPGDNCHTGSTEARGGKTTGDRYHPHGHDHLCVTFQRKLMRAFSIVNHDLPIPRAGEDAPVREDTAAFDSVIVTYIFNIQSRVRV